MEGMGDPCYLTNTLYQWWLSEYWAILHSAYFTQNISFYVGWHFSCVIPFRFMHAQILKFVMHFFVLQLH